MNPRITLLLALAVVLLASCGTVYVPSPHNVPLFSQADEAQAAMHIGTSGYNAQLAYSPARHIGLIGNGTYYKAYNDSTRMNAVRHTQGDIGLGYYTTLSKTARLEFFAGYGAGQTEQDGVNQLYRRLWFQPNFGYSGRIVDAGLTTGLAQVTHFQTKVNGGAVRLNSPALFLEPALTFRAGFEQLKFTSQLGWAIPLNGSGEIRTGHDALMLNFGFHLIIGKDFEAYLRR
jgi:hypothetical protein